MSQRRFKYKKVHQFNDVNKIVNVITFDLSRYGKYTCEMHFSEPITQYEAIESAESFLSGLITDDYFNKLKDDMYGDPKRENFKARSDALGNATFLEGATINRKGNMKLQLGS